MKTSLKVNSNKSFVEKLVLSELYGKLTGCENLTHYLLNHTAIEELGKEVAALSRSFFDYRVNLERAICEKIGFLYHYEYTEIDAMPKISEFINDIESDEIDKTHPYYIDFLLVQRDIQHLSHALDCFVAHIVNTYNVPKEEILIPLDVYRTGKRQEEERKDRETRENYSIPRHHKDVFFNDYILFCRLELKKCGVLDIDWSKTEAILQELEQAIKNTTGFDAFEDEIKIDGLEFGENMDLTKTYCVLKRLMDIHDWIVCSAEQDAAEEKVA